jgi:hypothetical protein
LARLDATEKALETGQPIPVTKHGAMPRLMKRAARSLALILALVLAVLAAVAPLTQLRSFHDIVWWWSLWYQHPWLTWTIRGLSIYGVLAFVGLFVALVARGERRGAGGAGRQGKRGWGLLGVGLAALAIAAAVLLAVFVTILAPFFGLFGILLAYAVFEDLRTPAGGGRLAATPWREACFISSAF